MYYAVKIYRQALFTSQLPNWEDVTALVVSSVAVFLLGGLFFRYMKKGFADVL
jgi:lipopolysaccharide transport system permease protein